MVAALAPTAVVELSATAAHATSLTCTDTFTNTDANGLWSDANNWSTTAVPGPSDVACMSGESVTISGSSAEVSAVQGGTLAVDAPLQIDDATSASSLDGLVVASALSAETSATIDVDGAVTWGQGSTGASIGAGVTIAQTTVSAFNVSGTGEIDDSGVVTTIGPVTLSDTDIVPAGSPTITTTNVANIAAATYASSTSVLGLSAAAVIFAGSATLPAICVTITGPTSTIEGTDSTLTLEGLDIANFANLDVPTGDQVNLLAGPSTLGGSINGGGTLTVNGSALVSNQSGTSVSTIDLLGGDTMLSGGLEGSNVTLSAGTAALGPYFTVSLGNYTQTGGSLVDTDGAAWYTQSLTWSGGTIEAGLLTGDCHIEGPGPTELIASYWTCSSIEIDSDNFTTTANGDDDSYIETLGNLSFGAGDVVQSGGADVATFQADTVTETGGAGTYGTGSDALVLFDGSGVGNGGGSATVASGSTLDSGPLTVLASSLTVDGVLDVPGGVTLEAYTMTSPTPTVSGTGTIDGNVEGQYSYDPSTSEDEYTGEVIPGSQQTPGTLKVNGDVDAWSVEAVAASPGSYSALHVTGTVDVSTVPILQPINNYTPTADTSFTLVTSDGLTLPPLNPYGPQDATPVEWASIVGNDLVITAYDPPSPPTNVRAVSGDQSATVTWTPSSDDGGAPITQYTVTGSLYTNPYTPTAPCTYVVGVNSGDTCTFTGLPIGKKYVFEVTASNGRAYQYGGGVSNVVTIADTTFNVDAPTQWTLGHPSKLPITCAVGTGTLSSCTVTITDPSSKVVASGTGAPATAAASVAVSVAPKASLASLAKELGGVLGTLTATGEQHGGGTVGAVASVVIDAAKENGTLEDAPLFTGTTNVLSTGGMATLSALASRLVNGTTLSCVGYTDNVGTAAEQHANGLARARAVCNVLDQDVAHTSVSSEGDAHPIASNGTAAGRAKNERVVVTVTF